MPFRLCADYQPAGDQPDAIAALVRGLEQGLPCQTLLGVTGSGKTFTMANVIQAMQRPVLVLAPNKTLAAQLYGELKEFFPENAVEYFVSYYDYYQPEAYVPASDTYIEKDASINSHIEQLRLSSTKSLLERSDSIIVATVSAIYGLGDPDVYTKMVLRLDRGQQIEQRQIIRYLVGLQYQRNPLELRRGCYRVHGDIIDVFSSASEDEATRIELFDDAVQSLSSFDPLTGEIKGKWEYINIHPTSHYVTDKETLSRAVESITQELEAYLPTLIKENKLVEAQRLEQRTRFDLEMMLQIGYCSGIENYSRHLSGRAAGEAPPTLFEYLPKDALLFIDESHVTGPQLSGMYRGDRARKENLVRYGFRLPSALDNRPLRFDEFEQLMPPTVFVSATPGPYEQKKSAVTVEQLVRPTGLLDPLIDILPATSQVDDLLSQIKKTISSGGAVLVTTLTKRMSEDLTEYLAEHKIKVRYLHSDIHTVERVEIIRDLRLGKFNVLVGINLLREGLDIPEVSLVAILDADKEGFLRSETTLIQTMGRAARHLRGRVVLYADKETGSIKRAVEETKRRRLVQKRYNKMHGITPRGINKKVQDIMQSAHNPALARKKRTKTINSEINPEISPTLIAKQITELEKKMYVHAREMEFEEAARVRDQIKTLQDALLSG